MNHLSLVQFNEIYKRIPTINQPVNDNQLGEFINKLKDHGYSDESLIDPLSNNKYYLCDLLKRVIGKLNPNNHMIDLLVEYINQSKSEKYHKIVDGLYNFLTTYYDKQGNQMITYIKLRKDVLMFVKYIVSHPKLSPYRYYSRYHRKQEPVQINFAHTKQLKIFEIMGLKFQADDYSFRFLDFWINSIQVIGNCRIVGIDPANHGLCIELIAKQVIQYLDTTIYDSISLTPGFKMEKTEEIIVPIETYKSIRNMINDKSMKQTVLPKDSEICMYETLYNNMMTDLVITPSEAEAGTKVNTRNLESIKISMINFWKLYINYENQTGSEFKCNAEYIVQYNKPVKYLVIDLIKNLYGYCDHVVLCKGDYIPTENKKAAEDRRQTILKTHIELIETQMRKIGMQESQVNRWIDFINEP